MTMIKFIPMSQNKKTGNISQTYSSQDSCPVSCPFKSHGCYAEAGRVALHWKNEKKFFPVENLKEKVEELSTKIIRHNVAGDIAIPGTDDIDKKLVGILCDAYKGKNAYTYTHCKPSERNLYIAKEAINKGFVINFSCESTESVEKIKMHGIPCVLAVTKMHGNNVINRNGITYRKCPADGLNITCRDCKLCSNPNRKEVVVFESHGASKKKTYKFLKELNEEG